jgi:hypothetical protein
MDCPKFVEMQKMFRGKNASSLDGKITTKVKIIIADVNLVDVNVVTRSKIIKDQCSRRENQGKIKILQIGRRRN